MVADHYVTDEVWRDALYPPDFWEIYLGDEPTEWQTHRFNQLIHQREHTDGQEY